MLGWRSLLVEQGCREGGAPQPHLTRLMQGWSSPSSPCKPQLSPVVIRRQTFDPYTWKHDLEGRNWHNLHQDWPFHPQCTWQWFFFFSWLRNWHRSLATRHILQLLSTHTHLASPVKAFKIHIYSEPLLSSCWLTKFSYSIFQGMEHARVLNDSAE